MNYAPMQGNENISKITKPLLNVCNIHTRSPRMSVSAEKPFCAVFPTVDPIGGVKPGSCNFR